MLKRAAKVTAVVFAVWLVVLSVLGFALGGRQERGTKSRLAESLLAQVTIADSDLALIRGRWKIEQLSLRRDDTVGFLGLDVATVRCELGPLGWALFDRDCSELAVRGVKLQVSTMALFKVKRPKKKPIRADKLIIDDATLVFLASAFAPTMGQVAIQIEHAESGPTLLRTPLSWLFTLKELRAKLDLPANVTVHLKYENGILTVAGSVFGTTPVELPVQLPVADLTKEAHEESRQLVQLAKDIGSRLVARRAQDWLESKLKPVPPPQPPPR